MDRETVLDKPEWLNFQDFMIKKHVKVTKLAKPVLIINHNSTPPAELAREGFPRKITETRFSGLINSNHFNLETRMSRPRIMSTSDRTTREPPRLFVVVNLIKREK